MLARIVAGLAGLALTACVLAAPSVASAVYLGKREARSVAVDLVRERMNERRWDWATWWQVERAYKCSRSTSRVVLCDFDYVDESDVDAEGYMYGCDHTVRIREARDDYWYRYPGSPDCGYWWTE